MAYFRQQFNSNQNCIMLQEYSCNECKAHFLTDLKGGVLHCPACGDLLNGEGAIVINQGVCKHNAKQDGHEYRP